MSEVLSFSIFLNNACSCLFYRMVLPLWKWGYGFPIASNARFTAKVSSCSQFGRCVVVSYYRFAACLWRRKVVLTHQYPVRIAPWMSVPVPFPNVSWWCEWSLGTASAYQPCHCVCAENTQQENLELWVHFTRINTCRLSQWSLLPLAFLYVSIGKKLCII